MANKKYKLTDGDYWASDGVYDLGQSKTQRQINSDLNGAINDNAQTYLVAETTWEQGSISGTGADTESTTRIRTKNYIPLDNVTSISGYIDSGYMFGVSWYDSSKTFISDDGWYNTTTKAEKPTNAAFCRIILAYSNSATITPSESSHIEVRLNMTVKNALATVNDKAKYDIYEPGVYVFERVVLPAYVTGSGNYIDFMLPITVKPSLSLAATYEKSTVISGSTVLTVAYLTDGYLQAPTAMSDNVTIIKKDSFGVQFEIGFLSTQIASRPATIIISKLTITAT